MTNPFYIYNSAAENMEKIKEMRVNRENDLDQCMAALIERRHNVLLYGERGIGKTYLLRLLEQELETNISQLFTCIVNVGSLLPYGVDDDVSAFPRAVLLQLCSALWTKLIKKSYLDLRDRIEETGQEITLRGEDERTIQRIYSHLMTRSISEKSKLLNAVGFSMGASGSKTEEKQLEKRHFDILPFEFGEFAEELIKKVLNKHGKERVLILCDEANHMPIFKQEEILDRYLDLFNCKKVQFLFVAGIVPWHKHTSLPACFESQLELKGFSKKEHIAELIKKVNCSDISFTSEAIESIYEAYKGHPRFSLMVCSRAYEHALENGEKLISAPLVVRLAQMLEEECRRWDAVDKPRMKEE